MGSFQGMLGCSNYGNSIDTNVDIVFAIDATGSMQPLIDKVKSLTLSFREKLEEGLKRNKRTIDTLRIKVIVFRDYYVDGEDAMEESRFFVLPEEKLDFYNFVSRIGVGGGGDEPESGLEALALALRSNFTQEGDKKRHIIVLFTDASAHPYEQQQDGTPSNYPANMFRNLGELYEAWGEGQGYLGGSGPKNTFMDRSAKRLVLFAPDMYPWNDLEIDFENTIRKNMDRGNGGADLDLDDVIALVAKLDCLIKQQFTDSEGKNNMDKLNFEKLLGFHDSIQTNVDIVFVIDATKSMKDIMESVKDIVLSFHKKFCDMLQEHRRTVQHFRIKVIWFRDFYYDEENSLGESRFFTMPDEENAFREFVDEIHADGGGDGPESALEALTLAMRSDFVQKGDKKRHIIVLFTDAAAHPFEDYGSLAEEASRNGFGPKIYPENMPKNLDEFYGAWADMEGLQDLLGSKLDPVGRRLILFAPGEYPWIDMDIEMELYNPKGLEEQRSAGVGGSPVLESLQLEPILIIR